MLDLKDILSHFDIPTDISRRGFLEVATASAAMAAMGSVQAQTGARPYIILKAPKGIILGDPNLCVNCQRCEIACTEYNDGKNDPVLSRIRIGRNMWYGPTGTTQIPADYGIWGNNSAVVQETCRQCDHPVPCANACPQGAIEVDAKTGARKVNEEKCIGCGLCQKACPWDMMSFDREKQKASKCFLCDGEPKCVKACPAAALHYLPWKDRSGEPGRRPTHNYLPEENRNQCGVCHG
jgi:Fe-S-cluster-containing dehydrogenase component